MTKAASQMGSPAERRPAAARSSPVGGHRRTAVSNDPFDGFRIEPPINERGGDVGSDHGRPSEHGDARDGAQRLRLSFRQAPLANGSRVGRLVAVRQMPIERGSADAQRGRDLSHRMLARAHRLGGGELLHADRRRPPAKPTTGPGRRQTGASASRMISRSNSASAPKIWNCRRPAGVVVSIAS
jgi:hypothetical protein